MKLYKPLVLVTNDDGIDSPGLHALIEALMPFCELLIVAPKFQQTGMGRGALSGKDIGSIEKRYLVVNGEEIKAYAVNGSPAQAVAHAILELTLRKPDFCVSGINYGENLGLSFTCSGTLGAAFEADSQGIKSIAFSRAIPLKNQRSDCFSDLNWDMEILHIRKMFLKILKYGMPVNVRILNVNFPTGIDSSTEVRVTKQAYMNYARYIHPGKRDFQSGQILGWSLRDDLHTVDTDTDIYAVHFDKVISVTPMTSLMSVDSKSYYG